MAAIDRWVITHAAQALKRAAISHADPANRITLNVSEQSLRSGDFATFVLDELFRAGLPAQAFSFDIKESAVVNNPRAAERFIRQMSDAGSHVGLDDFGLGLSSFAHLKSLPVQYLKIDGSLIRRVLTDSYAESVVKGIVKAAEILGVFTIAEHVESDEIAGRVSELDISFGQGYFYGKPQPLDRVFPQRGAS
jgi:Amt family ammonium transporter